MYNYKYILIHDMQVLIEIILKYILVYRYIQQYFNHISKTIELIMKLHIKMYLSPTYVGQKHAKVQLTVLNINLD